MKNPPSIEEVQLTYQNVFGEECPDPKNILENYIKFQDTWTPLDVSNRKYILQYNSLYAYLSDLKRQVDSKRARQEWQQNLAKMSPKERFLNEQGFTEPYHLKLQEAIDNSDQGRQIYSNVLGIFFDCEPNVAQELLKSIIIFASDHLEGCKKEFALNYLQSNEAKKVIGWFNGITNDGERALRTIHVCVSSFIRYCENQWGFHYEIIKI